jgi:hypothetical protein
MDQSPPVVCLLHSAANAAFPQLFTSSYAKGIFLRFTGSKAMSAGTFMMDDVYWCMSLTLQAIINAFV